MNANVVGVREFIADLAKRSGVEYERTGNSALAEVVTRLTGDIVDPDDTEKLVIALRRANVIDGRTMITLLGRYFDEMRDNTISTTNGTEFITRQRRNIADALAMQSIDDVEFEPLRVTINVYPADFS